MLKTRWNVLALLLLIESSWSNAAEISEEVEVIDLQVLLKDVSDSIKTFNNERLAISEELTEIKNNLGEIKLNIAEDKNAITKQLDDMKIAIAEDRKAVTKQLDVLKITVAENRKAITNQLDDTKITVAEDKKDITKKLDDMKFTVAEDHKSIARDLNEIKSTIADGQKFMAEMKSNIAENHKSMTKLLIDHQHVITEGLSDMKRFMGNMNSTITDLSETEICKPVKKCDEITSLDETTSTTPVQVTRKLTQTTAATTIKETTRITDTTTAPSKPRDCWEIYTSGQKKNGVYKIYPSGEPSGFRVFCDMVTDGGGWTVFQRRGQYGNPIDFFYKNWKDYKNGFGDLNREFWLGNDRISIMTEDGKYQLRIDLKDRLDRTAYAKYNDFSVSSEAQFYRLNVAGYSGNAGDSMTQHNKMYFSTKDVDKDVWALSCAAQHRGAWWYAACLSSNLNGLNQNGALSLGNQGIIWYHWTNSYSLRASEMKLRPKGLSSK